MAYYDLEELYNIEISPRDRYIIKNIYQIIVIVMLICFLNMVFLWSQN